MAEVALRPVEDSDLDRAFWGQDIAGRALALLLESVPVRPVFARAASDNVGSLKVLHRAGFVTIGTEISFANGRNAEIEETILRLDEPANPAPSDVSSRPRRLGLPRPAHPAIGHPTRPPYDTKGDPA